ncbi:hypothetical protein PHYSODRAFT_476324 [Phytophthora sojae]|uniref:RNase H type-1 domain-containing protein n=1 Tax=Phytophthora sojae (strain P6497) TaxID=1094619 RepID=G4YJP7_PHYSP|nr:hypothetical protein PHYSODRAFT_476324 [Phytophthora sojae]EGZ30159.1 hypothetical protein PHYSODRAFT_476324 [Phytophthora sojae]|eukprot:XP_009517434.1 hypothetical protein PHYSODRAFT_476324 [Phytophthora sojae]
MIMKGDVKGAFRHLMLASGHVRWMAATIPELGVLIVDMSAPVGWTSSPAFYGAFGGAITWLVTILGPGAINEDNFSSWESSLQVLGLVFDIAARTVSMPREKIAKALVRVQSLAIQQHITRTQLQQLLGSLRHVCSCLRAAKPFYQRLHAASIRAPRYGRIAVENSMVCDLQWFTMILTHGRLQQLPLARFTDQQPIDVHLYMDASNSGLAVFNPATQQYIQVRFDEEEQARIHAASGSDGFNINVREHLCVALAAWIFGPEWASTPAKPMIFVRAWSDNTSAVAWTNRLSSSNPLAQVLNRAIGLAEAIFGFRISCGHLPGAINTMADAGSRAWTSPFSDTWSNLSSAWS